MQTDQRVVDPFTIEVVKDGLTAVGDEMFETLLRTSMSPIIYEVLDFASGLTDARGRLITQGQGVTGFIGMLTTSVEAVLAKWAGRLEPGDIVITNDPYTGGGSHLSDVSLVAPIFIEGDLLAFAVSKAHWTEVGGMSPGSFTTDSTEIYQEGLQFPNVKIWSRGERNDSLVELIASNVRTPEQTVGDLMAQAAAMRVGERAFREVCNKYGTDVVLETIDALIAHGETIARLELGRLPKGTFEAVDYVDDDGLGGGPFEVRVKVTITDDEFVCDFTGSHAQVPGPVNNTFTGLLSAAQVAFKAVTSPGAAANHGSFAPLRVVCPPGTILSCERPAPCSIYWESLTFGTELIWRALAPHLPDRLGAGHMASVVGTIVAGPHADTGDFVVLVEPEVGGWGASPSADGNVGQFCALDGETFVTQAEIAEARFGLRVERFCLDPLGAGAGRTRGGPGCIREYRILRDGWIVTSTAGRHAFPVWGLHGGRDGSTNHVDVVKADGTVTRFGKVARHPLAAGDLVRVVTATGGGYGEPLERDPEAVAEDVRNGYVTVEQARQDYGVEVDAATHEVVGLPGRKRRAVPSPSPGDGGSAMHRNGEDKPCLRSFVEPVETPRLLPGNEPVPDVVEDLLARPASGIAVAASIAGADAEDVALVELEAADDGVLLAGPVRADDLDVVRRPFAAALEGPRRVLAPRVRAGEGQAV